MTPLDAIGLLVTGTSTAPKSNHQHHGILRHHRLPITSLHHLRQQHCTHSSQSPSPTSPPSPSLVAIVTTCFLTIMVIAVIILLFILIITILALLITSLPSLPTLSPSPSSSLPFIKMTISVYQYHPTQTIIVVKSSLTPASLASLTMRARGSVSQLAQPCLGALRGSGSKACAYIKASTASGF